MVEESKDKMQSSQVLEDKKPAYSEQVSQSCVLMPGPQLIENKAVENSKIASKQSRKNQLSYLFKRIKRAC